MIMKIFHSLWWDERAHFYISSKLFPLFINTFFVERKSKIKIATSILIGIFFASKYLLYSFCDFKNAKTDDDLVYMRKEFQWNSLILLESRHLR